MVNLTEFGLSEQESRIYLHLLKFDDLTAGNIAKDLGINRSVTYSHIDSLLNKGLISYMVKNNVKYFKAAQPDTLLQYLREKEVKLKEILPGLKQVKKESKDDITVEIYKGIGGGTTLLKDMMNEKKEILILGYEGQLEEAAPIFIKQYIRQLNENRIAEKILAKPGSKIMTGKYSEVRYLKKEFAIPTSTTIYGNKVIIIIYEQPFYAILIKSKQVAASYRQFFNLVWAISKNQ